MEKELGRIKAKLTDASPTTKAFWQPRADYLRSKLDGGRPPITVKPAQPADVKKALAKAPLLPAVPAATVLEGLKKLKAGAAR